MGSGRYSDSATRWNGSEESSIQIETVAGVRIPEDGDRVRAALNTGWPLRLPHHAAPTATNLINEEPFFLRRAAQKVYFTVFLLIASRPRYKHYVYILPVTTGQ